MAVLTISLNNGKKCNCTVPVQSLSMNQNKQQWFHFIPAYCSSYVWCKQSLPYPVREVTLNRRPHRGVRVIKYPDSHWNVGQDGISKQSPWINPCRAALVRYGHLGVSCWELIQFIPQETRDETKLLGCGLHSFDPQQSLGSGRYLKHRGHVVDKSRLIFRRGFAVLAADCQRVPQESNVVATKCSISHAEPALHTIHVLPTQTHPRTRPPIAAQLVNRIKDSRHLRRVSLLVSSLCWSPILYSPAGNVKELSHCINVTGGTCCCISTIGAKV